MSWTLGVWLNTILVNRVRRPVLIASSTTLLAVGIGGVGSVIFGTPLVIAYLAWPLAGLGMGIAFNTLTLNAMSAAPTGAEGASLGSRNLTGNLGTAIGTGVAGAAVAAGQRAQLGLRPGLAATFAVAALCALIAASLARRAGGRSNDPPLG